MNFARSLAVCLSIAAALLARPALAQPPKVFVLPVHSNGWLDHDDQLLEARVALALTRAHRVRPLGPRDLSAGARARLPDDLGACNVPACLRLLGQASGAVRVLALELFEEGETPVLLATLFDARTGEAVERRELPRAEARPSRAWADEVARWVGTTSAGVRPPPPAPPPPRPAAVLVSLALDGDQLARPEGQALLSELRDQLTRRGRPRLALAGQDGPITHRAVISVESFGISERPHHVHRYRSGALTASLTITEVRTGAVVFSKRGTAELTARAHHTTDQQTLGALVSDVVYRWMSEIDAASFDQLLARGL